jgi:hypothetical protein
MPPVEERVESFQEVQSEPDRVEPPKPSGSVSLWQKIFGSPAQQPPPPAEPVERVSDASEVVESSAHRPVAFRDESIESPAETFDAVDDVDIGFQSAAREPADEPGGELKRRRSRRRRGRGHKADERPDVHAGDARRPRGRREDGEMLETPGADDFDDLGPDDADGPDFDADAQIDEVAVGDDDGGGEPGAARSRSAGHRSIPSWDEAIGMIVEANLQTRTQRRPSGNSGPRGRPRGGRRRRKPS